MSVLEVRNMRKKFGGNEILHGINLSVDKGDVIAVIGPSGSGKTTMLRCLNFLERADEGEYIFEGQHLNMSDISHKKISEIRFRTGFVFQNYNLFLNKTALENVTEGLTVARKIPADQAKEIAMKALDRVGLLERADYKPSQLSGGQQQRVAIARAIATDPDIIFFDEPTSALDPELIGEVLEVMKNLALEGRTMIVVTHEMGFARDVSNKVVFMEDGNIVRISDSKSFFENPDDERIRSFIASINR
jgi:cystine transport system ATP-binding protein/L-cystine transport system ATP-binding protein